MNIEKASFHDLPEIHKLQKFSFLTLAQLYDDFTIPPMVETLDELRELFPTHVFLKAVEEGRIVGSVRASQQGDICYIYRLMVHPEFRRRGIARQLMQRIEEEFATVRRFELFTGCQSKKNLELYQKLGYRTFKTARGKNRMKLVYLEKIR
jgi:ribosomal protein S18 acetylase RimI-like enzyme